MSIIYHRTFCADCKRETVHYMEGEGRLTCVHEARVMKEHDEFEQERARVRRWMAGLGLAEMKALAEDVYKMLDHKATKYEVAELNKLWFNGGHAA